MVVVNLILRCGALGDGREPAKNLRGESMSDVIFNLPGARKPVGQASIELVFDNSEVALSANTLLTMKLRSSVK